MYRVCAISGEFDCSTIEFIQDLFEKFSIQNPENVSMDAL
jgi:hypothetical protein